MENTLQTGLIIFAGGLGGIVISFWAYWKVLGGGKRQPAAVRIRDRHQR